MVNSVRTSIGKKGGFEYEIVLVDGGSQDGSIEWMEFQPDVKLIKHASLLGAVKAFNDGAFASVGEYVVLANDDIEFLGNTIWLGWLYMQEHPDCGIGCFYQDRNGREWHVEEMPVNRDGKQAHAPYGQVCVVPKWLGDHVGWWGDYLHTYGGDNEISSRIYELGYKVSPVPGTKIHDNEAMDDLRKINNISGKKDPRAKGGGHHPDSWAWGRRWLNRSAGTAGPMIVDTPQLSNPIGKRERIVYLPIYESGWPVQKEQKRGLREALEEIGVVQEYDYVGESERLGKPLMIANLQKVIQELRPTIVLTQIHNNSTIGPSDIILLRKICSEAKFINWNGDFWFDNLVSEEGIELAKSFDLQTTVNRQALEKYRDKGINSEYWQIGWEPDGIGHEPEEFHHVVFLANGYSKDRQKFVRKLRKMLVLNKQRMDNISFGLYGQGWPDDWAKGQNLYNFVEACKIYRGAKISIGDSQWPDSGFVSNRIMQALAAGGSALAHQWFSGIEHLGLIDGQNIIVWKTFDELTEKIRYYLDNENERIRIAEAGEKLALEKHSFKMRVKELLLMLEDIRPQEVNDEEGWRW